MCIRDSNAHAALLIDQYSHCFGEAENGISFLAPSLGEALMHLLLGLRTRPMLHPNQTKVMLYGDVYTAEHPDIYRLG